MSKSLKTEGKFTPEAKRFIVEIVLRFTGVIALAFALDCIYQHLLRA